MKKGRVLRAGLMIAGLLCAALFSMAAFTLALGGESGDNSAGVALPQFGKPAAPQTAPPKFKISTEERGDIFMARKSYADAVDFYFRALKEPGAAEATKAGLYNKLGIAYQQEMDYSAAEKAYKLSTRFRHDFPEPLNNLGTIYFMEDKLGKSAKFYLQALKLNPGSASFHMNLGTAYYRRRKFDQAVAEYQTALTLDPEILTERSALGTVMETRGADANFYFYMAKSFALVGRFDECVRYLSRAFEDGFKDHKKLEQDPVFQKISQYPAYVELMKNPPVPIRD